jgi:hypothetical protein
MLPTPNRRHQKLLLNITRAFDNHFMNTPCEISFAPFDIRIPVNLKNIFEN